MHNEEYSVSQALAERHSVRGFLNTPVDGALIRDILQKAARAPSGGNVQPWHIYVLGGTPLQRFKAHMAEHAPNHPKGEMPYEYAIYPADLKAPYRDYRFEVGEDLYTALGIARDNKIGRLMWFSRNFQFFGAPLALFCYVDRTMGAPQWSDLGMYLQSVMLLLREAGLDSCAQECWSIFHDSVRKAVGAPETLMLFCGMAIGYKDPENPANHFRSKRAALESFAHFEGI
jgi:nitroreductase